MHHHLQYSSPPPCEQRTQRPPMSDILATQHPAGQTPREANKRSSRPPREPITPPRALLHSLRQPVAFISEFGERPREWTTAMYVHLSIHPLQVLINVYSSSRTRASSFRPSANVRSRSQPQGHTSLNPTKPPSHRAPTPTRTRARARGAPVGADRLAPRSKAEELIAEPVSD